MSNSMKAIRARKKVMSLQDDSTALRKDLEAEIGDKIRVWIVRSRLCFNLDSLESHFKLARKHLTLRCRMRLEAGVSLSSLLKKEPVVLSFYRGEWCPFCNLELRAYQQALPKMEALGAAFVAVSPEKPEFAQLLANKQNDADRGFARLGSWRIHSACLQMAAGGMHRLLINSKWNGSLLSWTSP